LSEKWTDHAGGGVALGRKSVPDDQQEEDRRTGQKAGQKTWSDTQGRQNGSLNKN
jgi:hypothetical protein